MAQENRLKIHIASTEYAIRTNEEPSYVREIAAELDAQVRDLMNTGVSMNEALMLAALSGLDDCKKARADADHLRSQVTEYIEDAAKARLEAEEKAREAESLRRKLGEKKQG